MLNIVGWCVQSRGGLGLQMVRGDRDTLSESCYKQPAWPARGLRQSGSAAAAQALQLGSCISPRASLSLSWLQHGCAGYVVENTFCCACVQAALSLQDVVKTLETGEVLI